MLMTTKETGMTIHRDCEGIGPLYGVKNLISLTSAESTQDIARELAIEGEDEGTLVVSASQTKGKGRLGRSWDSGPGGVYMTLILRPRVHARLLKEFSLVAAKTVSETLSRLYGVKTSIKPPNDVMAWHPVKRKYLKVSGILTESSSAQDVPDWMLLGMGINLENTLPKELATAAGIRAITRKPAPAGLFLQAFFKTFWKTYSAWETGAVSRSF
ncbi:MAG: biotin--[acetyl-CoA-carboxylase] ligase [bacterium]